MNEEMLIKEHGTYSAFCIAIWKAYFHGVITNEEANAAIEKYAIELSAAVYADTLNIKQDEQPNKP